VQTISVFYNGLKAGWKKASQALFGPAVTAQRQLKRGKETPCQTWIAVHLWVPLPWEA
jgi:hypothetical protein